MTSGSHDSRCLDKLNHDITPPKVFKYSRSRVMYIEDKSAGLEGPARIGRV